METTPRRRFTVVDAMVLVAATGVGLRLARFSDWYALHVQDHVASYLEAVGLCWAAAIVALNFRQPRSSLRELANRPGFSAGVAVLVGRTLWALHVVVIMVPPHAVFTPSTIASDFAESVIPRVAHPETAGTVMAVWAVMAMGGRWHADRSWLDHLGRALGVFWPLAWILYWVSMKAMPVP